MIYGLKTTKFDLRLSPTGNLLLMLMLTAFNHSQDLSCALLTLQIILTEQNCAKETDKDGERKIREKNSSNWKRDSLEISGKMLSILKYHDKD